MRSRILSYAVEFVVVLVLVLVVFAAYHMRSEPTRFIYYNF